MAMGLETVQQVGSAGPADPDGRCFGFPRSANPARRTPGVLVPARWGCFRGGIALTDKGTAPPAISAAAGVARRWGWDGRSPCGSAQAIGPYLRSLIICSSGEMFLLLFHPNGAGPRHVAVFLDHAGVEIVSARFLQRDGQLNLRLVACGFPFSPRPAVAQ